VEIVFLDSMTLSHGGWFDPDDEQDAITDDAMRHWAVGYVVGESKAGVLVAGMWSQHGIAGSVTAIPKRAIVSRRVL